jgi:hypothetical protein
MTETQLKFIVEEARILDKDSRVAIARILFQHDPTCLQDKSDGTRVILNNISDDVINKICIFIENKLQSL